MGLQDLVRRSCVGLNRRLRLECNGVEVPLPPDAEGLVVLNIGCHMVGGGRRGGGGAFTVERLLAEMPPDAVTGLVVVNALPASSHLLGAHLPPWRLLSPGASSHLLGTHLPPWCLSPEGRVPLTLLTRAISASGKKAHPTPSPQFRPALPPTPDKGLLSGRLGIACSLPTLTLPVSSTAWIFHRMDPPPHGSSTAWILPALPPLSAH